MKARSQHSPIKSAILALGIGLNLFVAMLTVFSAYGGTFDPETRVIAAMAAMVLPILLIAGIVIVLTDLIIDARLILIIGAGWLLSLSPILTFCPLNVPRSSLSAEEKERSFNMLTYNIFHFWDFRGGGRKTICQSHASPTRLRQSTIPLSYNKCIRQTFTPVEISL